MALKNNKSNDKFVSILSDATMRLVVPEGTEGAVKRDYETSDGKTGTKHELVFTELSGFIKEISFYDGDFGKLIQLKVEDGDEEPVVLSLGTATNFGEDIMKKLPNIDLEKRVTLSPYSFEDKETKKNHRGISIKQDDQKIESFYYDKAKKKNINGYPDTKFKSKKVSSDDWKLYFLNARVFLIEDITKRFKIVEKTGKDNDFNNF